MRVGKRAERKDAGSAPAAPAIAWAADSRRRSLAWRAAVSPVSQQWPPDIAFLDDVDPAELVRAAEKSERAGFPAAEALIRRGAIARNAYEARLAAHCGVERLQTLPADFSVCRDGRLAVDAAYAVCEIAGIRRVAIAPQTAGYDRTARAALAGANAFDDCVFVDAADLRHAIFDAHRRRQLAEAVGGLASRAPEFSSSRRLSGGQTLTAIVLVCAGVAGAILAPRIAYLAIGGAFSAFYLGVVLLRAWLAIRIDSVADRPAPAYGGDPADVPIYSVLVALRGEANQVRRLLRSLAALDWPADRLEVLFACEEDDPPTVRALQEAGLPEGWRIVVCPAGRPATKPRALSHALPLARGEFLVIYDAEDRPHPRQLREAFARFRRASATLACLQAPLLVDNRSRNWLTRMFAMEYRALFCGQLPVLEMAGGPIPLGGTSNHFRVSVLRACGGWDPFNVTEDADLGIRLARMGFRCGTLRLPTWEEAPENLGVWLRQRTRWLKGWIQTILVHSRAPARTLRSLGLAGMLRFHLLFSAIVVSMLAHPVFLAVAGYELRRLVQAGTASTASLVSLGVSVFVLVGGYTTHAAFLLAVAHREGVRFRRFDLATLPVYWLLISLAGWRAAVQFLWRPFQWEKTAHGLAERQEFAHFAGENGDRRRGPHRKPGRRLAWTSGSAFGPEEY